MGNSGSNQVELKGLPGVVTWIGVRFREASVMEVS